MIGRRPLLVLLLATLGIIVVVTLNYLDAERKADTIRRDLKTFHELTPPLEDNSVANAPEIGHLRSIRDPSYHPRHKKRTPTPQPDWSQKFRPLPSPP